MKSALFLLAVIVVGALGYLAGAGKIDYKKMTGEINPFVQKTVDKAGEELKKAGDSIKEKQMDKLKEGIAESINEKETTDKKENGTIAKLDITGSWSVEKGPYQKIIIFEDGSYSAFLNDKPLIEGNWYFIDGVFALVAKQNPELSEGFSAITKNGDTLTLQTNEGTLT